MYGWIPGHGFREVVEYERNVLSWGLFPLVETGSISMKPARLMFYAIAVLCAGSRVAEAADPRYPDWPCAQAKVPDISIAAVWDGPPIEQAQNGWPNDQAIKSLVARLAARRLPIEEAQKNITEFLAGSGTAKADKGALLFAGLFETLNRQRTDVMNGLERLQRSQRELADRIKSDVSTLHELQDKPQPDQAKLDEFGGRIEWSTRIFEDRRKSVRYACEVPIIIERRLFALGRTIRQEAE
jgi:hypothetical protein